MAELSPDPSNPDSVDLDGICLACTEYQDGDVLGLSDLIDLLGPLRSCCDNRPVAQPLVDGLLLHCQYCLRTGTNLRRDFVADSLDRLRFVFRQPPESLVQLQAELQDTVEDWRTRFADCLQPPQPPSAPSAPEGTCPELPEASNIFAKEEVFNIFLMDAQERLVTAQELCLKLEADPQDDQACQELFRIFHTFKGECGFFKLATIGDLAHNFENLLDLMRSHSLAIDSVTVNTLLRGIDSFQVLIDNLSRKDIVIHQDIDLDDLKKDIEGLCFKVRQPIGDKLVAAGMISEAEKVTILQKQRDQNFAKPFGEVAVAKNLVSRQDVETVAAQTTVPVPEHRSAKAGPADDHYIKVHSSQINYLVDMIGELLIAQNLINPSDPAALSLKKITKEIQLAALLLRTTKLKTVVFNVHRALRDVAQTQKKQVNFISRGEELEIDRTLVESLSEPLLHLIRNAVGHGIEKPDERLAKGKPAEGTVILEAQRRGNSIILSVEDDGKGLDREAILKKGLAQGLVPPGSEKHLTDREVWDLIFCPGFSTAEVVDQLSGRGVGMDIVKTFVQANRGRIEIQTELGRFTRFNLHFPISTAIIDGMIAMIGAVSVIVPVNQVVESLNYNQTDSYNVNGDVDVINLRGNILPVINLGRFFDCSPVTGDRVVGVVVEDSAQKRYVFLVDKLIGKREVVVKPLGARFKHLKAISSGTVLNGGQVGYILDIDNIVRESSHRLVAASTSQVKAVK